ncbi:MAG: hypothetical protein ACRDKE_02465 [Solirubrobacterales bacterium]
MALTTSSTRLRAVILGFMTAALLALAFSASAHADDAAPTPATGATGTVGALGADPTVRVATRKHCVNSKVKIAPQYSGGGGLVISYVFLNEELVATRRSIGPLSISIKRFERGLNGLELISEFSDGRVASISRNIRRCGGH